MHIGLTVFLSIHMFQPENHWTNSDDICLDIMQLEAILICTFSFPAINNTNMTDTQILWGVSNTSTTQSWFMYGNRSLKNVHLLLQ